MKVPYHSLSEVPMRQVALLSALAVALGLGATALAADWARRNTTEIDVELVLHYDFLADQTLSVTDFSGKKHDGTLRDGEIVYGRRKNAVKLDGKGFISLESVPDTLNPTTRPLTVGAFCQPTAPDGVLVAMGDTTNGFSLYLKDSVPHFVVRAEGVPFKVAAEQPVALNQWVHLAGAIDATGQVWLIVNGWAGDSADGKLIPQKSSEPFSVGADPGLPVGEYTSPLPWHGLVQDIRLYWGFLDRSENRNQWGDWADLPGCGCSK